MKNNQPKLRTRTSYLALLLLMSRHVQAMEPQIVFSFQNGAATLNGVHPQAGLTLGPDGNFYGTTRHRGSNSAGTIFRLTPDGVFSSLFACNNTNGAAPQAGLALGNDGNFYGTTTRWASSVSVPYPGSRYSASSYTAIDRNCKVGKWQRLHYRNRAVGQPVSALAFKWCLHAAGLMDALDERRLRH